MLHKPRLALLLAGLCGLILGLAILYSAPPERNRFAPPCLFHKMTGLHCPGCGATRAVYALLHLQPLEALQKNAVFVLALPFLVVWGVRTVIRWLYGQPTNEVPALIARPWRIGMLFGVLILFGVLRNLPWEPFSLLAPR